MSTQYESLKDADLYRNAFRVEPPAELGERHITPRKSSFFIARTLTGATDTENAAARAALLEASAESTATSDAPAAPAAAASYATEVRARTFPGIEQTYQPK